MAFVMSPENLMPPSAISGMLPSLRGPAALGNRGKLRYARARDDARGADGARPDPDLDAIHAQRDQFARAFIRADVADDQLHVRQRILDRFDRIDHAQAVRMRRIDREHVDLAAHQFLRALEKVAGGADRRARAQTALFVFGGVRILELLLNVLDRDQTLQKIVIVHHEQFLHAMPVQNFFRLIERRAHGNGDQVAPSSSRPKSGRSKRDSKRRSRLVRMPTSLPSCVTGTPEMR